jgi:predicted dinucleotide-utilizing enzyme
MTSGSRSPRAPVRVGVIGYGLVGRALVQRIPRQSGLELGFVHARSMDKLTDVAPELRAPSLDDQLLAGVDLVVEAAHPVYSIGHGARILRHADYLPLSTSALADEWLLADLQSSAREHGHRLLLPHGALVGLESLVTGRASWEQVTITFIKNPIHLDAADGVPLAPDREAVVYDGPVRGIAAAFPRNVNSMVTLGLATIGLDACRGRLIARPGIARAQMHIEAVGRDGSRIAVQKEQPMDGVSGSEMVDSTWLSLLLAACIAVDGMAFV